MGAFPPVNSNLTIGRGSDGNLEVLVYADATRTTKVDLTGGSVTFTIRKRRTDVDNTLQLTETAGITIKNQTNYPGELVVTITKEQTNAMLAGDYYYELKAVVGAIEYVPLVGTLTLFQNIPVSFHQNPQEVVLLADNGDSVRLLLKYHAGTGTYLLEPQKVI